MGKCTMRRICFLLLRVALGFAVIMFFGLASASAVDPSLAEKHLSSLNLIASLDRAGINDLKIAVRDPEFYQKDVLAGKITSSVETNDAFIYGYNGTEIPNFLIDNFNRIFGMVNAYFNIKERHERIVIWVMDIETLWHTIPSTSQIFPEEDSTSDVSLYAPFFNFFFFTPQYINDYYITHELIHYLIDQYEGQVILGLPQTIKKRKAKRVRWDYFLKGNEEQIADELAKIILQWGEHQFFWKKN